MTIKGEELRTLPGTLGDPFRVLGLLPGVELARADGNVLSVDPRVARFFTNDLFHLLGYRRQEERDERLVFTRRNDKL